MIMKYIEFLSFRDSYTLEANLLPSTYFLYYLVFQTNVFGFFTDPSRQPAMPMGPVKSPSVALLEKQINIHDSNPNK